MAELAYFRLNADQVEAEVNKLDGWLVVDDRLSKGFEFASYLEGGSSSPPKSATRPRR